MIKVKVGDVLVAVCNIRNYKNRISIRRDSKYVVNSVDYEKNTFSIRQDTGEDAYIPIRCLDKRSNIHRFVKLNKERIKKIKSFLEN